MHPKPQPVKILTSRSITFLVVIFFLFLAFLSFLQPDPARADIEQYLVFSDYLVQGLTGESHSLGSRDGTIVIEENTRGGLREGLFLIDTFADAKRNL